MKLSHFSESSIAAFLDVDERHRQLCHPTSGLMVDVLSLVGEKKKRLPASHYVGLQCSTGVQLYLKSPNQIQVQTQVTLLVPKGRFCSQY